MDKQSKWEIALQPDRSPTRAGITSANEPLLDFPVASTPLSSNSQQPPQEEYLKLYFLSLTQNFCQDGAGHFAQWLLFVWPQSLRHLCLSEARG